MKKTYKKPMVLEISKTKSNQSVQLAGVRATQTMILKSELNKK